MSYQAKNILVTGGAGFIGSNYIINKLTKKISIKIINLDSLTYAGNLENLVGIKDDPNYQFVQGDINDTALVEQLLEKYDIDTIVHFAAESHVDRSIEAPNQFINTNILGTESLLRAAREVWLHQKKLSADACRFHHISTDEVYGSLSKTDPAFTEETPYQPNSPYAASKAGSDHIVRAYFHTYKLPVTMTNCSNNFGRYQNPEKLIPTIINACKNQKPIPVYGDGSNIRDWLYVMDHCEAIDLVIANGRLGESYNVGGNNEISNLELVKKICDFFNKNYPKSESYHSLITFVEDRKGHDWRYAIDNKKITNQLNWQPCYNFDEVLSETINFYLQ